MFKSSLRRLTACVAHGGKNVLKPVAGIAAVAAVLKTYCTVGGSRMNGIGKEKGEITDTAAYKFHIHFSYICIVVNIPDKLLPRKDIPYFLLKRATQSSQKQPYLTGS